MSCCQWKRVKFIIIICTDNLFLVAKEKTLPFIESNTQYWQNSQIHHIPYFSQTDTELLTLIGNNWCSYSRTEKDYYCAVLNRKLMNSSPTGFVIIADAGFFFLQCHLTLYLHIQTKKAVYCINMNVHILSSYLTECSLCM